MNLATRIAEAMASDSIDRLPRLTRHASPEYARDLLEAYYRLRDVLDRSRIEEGESWTVEERLAAASIRYKLEQAIEHVRDWLSRVARRGGRGVPLQAPSAKESVSARL